MVDETMVRMLNRLEIRAPVSCGPLHLFPLSGGESSDENLTLLADARAEETLRVEELDANGSVPELRVINQSPTPVLILEGDELVGS